VVWKYLTRPKNVGQFAATVNEELVVSFDKYWGKSGAWSSCKVFETCAQIIARTTNRTYFGLPLSESHLFFFKVRLGA